MEEEWYQARGMGKSPQVWAMAEGLQSRNPLPALPKASRRSSAASQRSREESERRLLEASEKRKRRRQKRLQQLERTR